MSRNPHLPPLPIEPLEADGQPQFEPRSRGATTNHLHGKERLLQFLPLNGRSRQQSMSHAENRNVFQHESRRETVRRTYGSRLETKVKPQPGTYAHVLASTKVISIL